MVHPFLRRRQGLEPMTFPSAEMEKALKRTLGVPIFQEQVMQVAMLAAGFSAGEADQLHRAMAARKRKGGLEPYHDRLVSGMLARGYDREFADAIFSQIKGFGEYGFPESTRPASRCRGAARRRRVERVGFRDRGANDVGAGAAGFLPAAGHARRRGRSHRARTRGAPVR